MLCPGSAIVNSGFREDRELSPASVYISLLSVVEACVVVGVRGCVGEVRVAADEAVDLDPGVLALPWEYSSTTTGF